MNGRLELLRKKRTDWIITWEDDKLRWIVFYYLVGLIVGCLLTFFEELLVAFDVRYLYKSLMLTVAIPVLTVAVSIYVAVRRR